MSKAEKIWLLIAACLVVVGLFLFAAVMSQYNWNFTKLSTAKFETNTYEIKEAFNNIRIDVDTTEIEFLSSDGEGCRIDCMEMEKVKHSAAVQDETLVIKVIDTRKWYDHIGIFLSIRTRETSTFLGPLLLMSLKLKEIRQTSSAWHLLQRILILVLAQDTLR